jgi:integrase
MLSTSKNGEARLLPLVGKALEELRALKLQGGGRSAHVFPNLSGLPGAYENFDKHWYAALKAAEISGFRFHRPAAFSGVDARRAGLLAARIADVLGHKSITMTRRYSHLLVEHKASVVERMARAKGL